VKIYTGVFRFVQHSHSERSFSSFNKYICICTLS